MATWTAHSWFWVAFLWQFSWTKERLQLRQIFSNFVWRLSHHIFCNCCLFWCWNTITSCPQHKWIGFELCHRTRRFFWGFKNNVLRMNQAWHWKGYPICKLLIETEGLNVVELVYRAAVERFTRDAVLGVLYVCAKRVCVTAGDVAAYSPFARAQAVAKSELDWLGGSLSNNVGHQWLFSHRCTTCNIL